MLRILIRYEVDIQRSSIDDCIRRLFSVREYRRVQVLHYRDRYQVGERTLQPRADR